MNGDDTMKLRLQHSKTIYNYQSSKKIYFSNNSSKCYLFEKKESSAIQGCQLLLRDPVVIHSKTGLVVYSGKNKS